MAKRIITVSVDRKVYFQYSKLCKDKGFVISKQVEIFMKRFLDE